MRFADGSFIRRGRLPEDRPPQGHCPRAPALIIEAVSPHDTASALAAKIAHWLSADVQRVWVLYPETHRLQVHRADGTVTKLQVDDQLSGEEVIPGFQYQGAAVFQGLSAWPRLQTLPTPPGPRGNQPCQRLW